MFRSILIGMLLGVAPGLVLRRMLYGRGCRVVTGRDFGRVLIIVGAIATVGVAVVIGILVYVVHLIAGQIKLPRADWLIYSGVAAVVLIHGVAMLPLYFRYRNRNRIIAIMRCQRDAVEKILLEVLSAHGWNPSQRRKRFFKHYFEFTGGRAIAVLFRKSCNIEIAGEHREVCDEVYGALRLRLEQYAATAPVVGEFQFSLRTAMLAMLLIGSALTLNFRWDPWVRERTWNTGDVIHPLAFSPDGHKVAVGDLDGGAAIWNFDSGEALELPRHKHDVESVSFSPDGKFILTADNVSVTIADSGTGAQLVVIPLQAKYAYGYRIVSANFSHLGEQIVVSESDHRTHLFDMDARLVKTFENDVTLVESGTLENKEFAAAFRRLDNGRLGKRLTLRATGQNLDLELAPDFSRMLMVTKYSAVMKGWAFRRPGEDIFCSATFSPNADRIVTVERHWPVSVWNQPFDRPEHEFRGMGDEVVGASFSPDGSQLVAGANAGFTIWDVQSGEKRSEVRDYFASGLARFCPDGKRVITGIVSLSLWTPRRPDGPWGVLALPELWTTLLLLGCVAWSIWRDRKAPGAPIAEGAAG